jgi:hypothetical protein
MLTLGRRSFCSIVFLQVLLLKSCAQVAADVETNVKIFLPVIVTSVTQILNLLASTGVLPLGTGTAAAGLLAMINAGVTTALTTIDEYENDPAADKATLAGKLRTVLSAIADNVSTFISNLKLTGNPAVNVVASLVSILLSAITGYVNQLPAPVGARLSAPAPAMVAGHPVEITPTLLARKDYVAKFNAAIPAEYAQFQIH